MLSPLLLLLFLAIGLAAGPADAASRVQVVTTTTDLKVPAFEANRQAFLTRVDQSLARWTAELAPFKGTKVVVDHNMWIYFLTRFGLVEAGSIEERPGIPPTPSHLTKLIALMKDQKVRVILSVPWGDQKIAERVAQEAGAKVVPLAPAAGSVKGADGYLETIDYNVRSVAQALK
jgi:ABC-type Zn uptake system ZnuABC Zn-binding protein ZnuA